MFDKRIAEITGSSITALSTSQAAGGDCSLPLNINDTDLNTHAKEPPQPYLGPTEMLFALTRIQLTVAAAPNGSRAVPTGANKPRVHYSPSPSSPDVVTHVGNANLPAHQDIDGYCNYIENFYLKQCDPKVPLHNFTLMMTRQALCKLRVIDFMCRGVSVENIEPHERDALFGEAIRTIEYDNLLLSNESVSGFSWYMHMHFPFPAYIFLMSEVRARRTGEMTERAWDIMLENHERRGMMRNLRSPMHITFGNMFIKAWDAREAAEMALGNQVPVPKLIEMLRLHMAKINPKRGAAAGGGGPAGTGQGGMGGGGRGQLGAYGQQPMPGSAPASSSSPSMSMPSSSAGYASQKAMSEAPMGDAMGGGMSMDGSNMGGTFGGFDGGNPLFGGGPMADGDFGQMDWSHYMLQFNPVNNFGGGYGGMGGGWPVPPTGHPGGAGGQT